MNSSERYYYILLNIKRIVMTCLNCANIMYSTKEETMIRYLKKTWIVILTGMCLAGCSGETGRAAVNDDIEKTAGDLYEVSEEELSEELTPFCTIDENRYVIPLRLEDFLRKGWTIRLDDSAIEEVNYQDPAETKLAPGEYIPIQLRTEGSTIQALVRNRKAVNIPVTEGEVFEITSSGNSVSETFHTMFGITFDSSAREIRDALSGLTGYEDSTDLISLKKSQHETVLSISLDGNSVSNIDLCAVNPWMFRQHEANLDLEKTEQSFKASAVELNEKEADPEAAVHLKGTVVETIPTDLADQILCRTKNGYEFVFEPDMTDAYGVEILPSFANGTSVEIWGNPTGSTERGKEKYPLYSVFYAEADGKTVLQLKP